jgi:hypothetical protein
LQGNDSRGFWDLFNKIVSDFLIESRRTKLCDIRRILAALPDDTGAPFSDIPKLGEECWFSLGEITNYIVIPWTQVIGFLNENRETEVLTALNRLDIVRLNEVIVIVIFTRFIKCVERNSISCFDKFPMLQKLMFDLGSLRANKHAETPILTVLERFSRTADLNVIFVCCLVTPAGKKYDGAIEQLSRFSAGMEAMCNRAATHWRRCFLRRC